MRTTARNAGPVCPDCAKPMRYDGGSMGWIRCNTKILTRNGGWHDEKGRHVKDDPLAGGQRRVDGLPLD
jgi:hypothetical protein